jgi:hypothetical protein
MPDGSVMQGEYRDSFRRHDGVWRFSARVYTIFRTPAAC